MNGKRVCRLMLCAAIVGAAAFAFAPESLAGGSQVTFTLTGPQSGQTVAPGSEVEWRLAVVVSGDNQGIAGYGFDVILHAGTMSGAVVETVAMPLPNFTASFNVDGRAGLGSAPLDAAYYDGGPAMTFTAPGVVVPGGVGSIGAVYSPPWTFMPATDRMSYGIGIGLRKSALLGDPSADYVLNDGVLTAPAEDGWYVLVVTPQLVTVLNPVLDLTQDLTGNFARAVQPGVNPDDTITTASLAFYVSASGAPPPTPPPATGGGSGGGGGIPGGGGTNQSPTAIIMATPTAGGAPLDVTLDATSSMDPDGDTMTYSWQFGDGQSTAAATTTHRYTAKGTYTVVLTADDGHGGRDTAEVTITVNESKLFGPDPDTGGGSGTNPPPGGGGGGDTGGGSGTASGGCGIGIIPTGLLGAVGLCGLRRRRRWA